MGNGTSKMSSFKDISRDAKVRFGDLQYFSYGKILESRNFINIDTLNVVTVEWTPTLSDSIMIVKEGELSEWLKKELSTENVTIKRN